VEKRPSPLCGEETPKDLRSCCCTGLTPAVWSSADCFLVLPREVRLPPPSPNEEVCDHGLALILQLRLPLPLPLPPELGHDTYAVDMLGWGFSERLGQYVKGGFSADAKRDALYSFWRDEMQGEPVVLAGASLGGAAAIEFAAAHPHAVAGMVLIDAQGFVDGVGMLSKLPDPLARLGIQILKSRPLRRMANDMSYADPRFATEDAMRIGRLHTLRVRSSSGTACQHRDDDGRRFGAS